LSSKTSSRYLVVAKIPDVLNSILKSSDRETQNCGQKIKHALSLDSSDLHIDVEAKPGGRHDNSHADHREVSIMPRADELFLQERPFLLTAYFIEDP
jgi:hypothetical protein